MQHNEQAKLYGQNQRAQKWEEDRQKHHATADETKKNQTEIGRTNELWILAYLCSCTQTHTHTHAFYYLVLTYLFRFSFHFIPFHFVSVGFQFDCLFIELDWMLSNIIRIFNSSVHVYDHDNIFFFRQPMPWNVSRIICLHKNFRHNRHYSIELWALEESTIHTLPIPHGRRLQRQQNKLLIFTALPLARSAFPSLCVPSSFFGIHLVVLVRYDFLCVRH